jgi:hypothetical protein
MMRALLSLVTASCFACAAGAAASASRMDWQDASRAKSRKIAASYASCIVKTRRSEAVSALNAPFGGDDTSGRFVQLASSSCLHDPDQGPFPTRPVLLRMPPLVMRGLLYESLYRKDFGKLDRSIAIAAAAPIAYLAAGDGAVGSLGRNYRGLMLIGDCIVRSAPTEARVLVLSAVASRGEATAIEALGPALGTCVPAGRKISFSPEVLRGMIAEPLYRLSDRAVPTREAGR